MNKHKIVVCEATEVQGRAVVISLLRNKKFQVTAVTKDPDSDCAQFLAGQGATVIKADLSDQSSIYPVFENAYGVFGITQASPDNLSSAMAKKEILQGKNIIWAAKMQNVKHVIFSSALLLDTPNTGVAHFESNSIIEFHIKDQRLPYTIVKYPQLMENMEKEFFQVKKRVVQGFVPADVRVPYVSAVDAGILVAKAFDQPAKFLDRTLSLIGDFITGKEIAAILHQLRGGEQFSYKPVSGSWLRFFAPEYHQMNKWFQKINSSPFAEEVIAGMDEFEKEMPQFTGMREYLAAKNYRYKILAD
jgi:uncharacterized protein YbjT (DUF2867 family)